VASIQITCINKLPRNNPHEGITHLGSGGNKWIRAQIVDWIESLQHTFYTNVAGRVAWIGVVEGPNGKYLRTYADGVWNDNLLALPECP